MERPARKKIRLEGWNYSGAATYFLTLCTKGRKPLLSRVVGCGILDAPQLQLSEYGTCVQEALMYLENQQKNMQFHISVIMPNHVHILLTLCETVGASHGASRMPRPTNQVIPMFVSSLKRFTNRKTGVDLWQKSYHDHIIRNEQDFLQVWQYIDDNPAQWLEDCYYENEENGGSS